MATSKKIKVTAIGYISPENGYTPIESIEHFENFYEDLESKCEALSKKFRNVSFEFAAFGIVATDEKDKQGELVVSFYLGTKHLGALKTALEYDSELGFTIEPGFWDLALETSKKVIGYLREVGEI